MNTFLKKSFLILSATLVLILGNSCQRAATCPAYSSVDPSKSNINMSKEKFVNAEVKPKTPEDNKKEVEKRKNAELNKKYNRKKSTNLFPSYMR
jgi:hypothetical protein